MELDKLQWTPTWKLTYEPWDVHMCDILSGRITLEGFLLKMLVGGFSYADVLEATRGWAATILFNKELKAQFVNMRVEKSNAIMLKGSMLGRPYIV